MKYARQQQNYFNSQPHEEADMIVPAVNKVAGISTHSLTKRLTRSGTAEDSAVYYFNSQPHEEADGLDSSRHQEA